PTALFIERPSFRIIDNGIFIPRPPCRHNPATSVLYHIYNKNTTYKFCNCQQIYLANLLAVTGFVSHFAPLFQAYS
ncbi:MAG: hypothetical protein ACI3U2_08830, partial [Anaerovibrio sp.]